MAVVTRTPPAHRAVPLSRRRRRRARALLALIVVIALAGGLSTYVFVRPRTDTVLPNGLVVVLGSAYKGDRLELAAELASPTRVLLVSTVKPCPRGYDGRFLKYRSMACFKASPLTTRGEAQYVARYAAAHHLHSITVITSDDQVWRARLRFDRCTPADVHVVAAHDRLLSVLSRVPYQIAASIKALTWQRAC